MSFKHMLAKRLFHGDSILGNSIVCFELSLSLRESLVCLCGVVWYNLIDGFTLALLSLLLLLLEREKLKKE